MLEIYVEELGCKRLISWTLIRKRGVCQLNSGGYTAPKLVEDATFIYLNMFTQSSKIAKKEDEQW